MAVRSSQSDQWHQVPARLGLWKRTLSLTCSLGLQECAQATHAFHEPLLGKRRLKLDV